MTIAKRRDDASPQLSTKERIEREAISIFSEKGYDAASMREIAEASGVSKPVVYYYFKSKENLCHYLISAGLDEFRRRLRHVCENGAGDAFERLGMMVRTHFDFCEANIEFVRFMYALTFGPDRKKINYDFHAYDAEISDLLTGLLLQASEAGLIRKGKEDAAMQYVRGIISRYSMYHVDGNRQFSPGLAETIVTDMVDGLRP
jgi:AcrR family transcriptional regulator